MCTFFFLWMRGNNTFVTTGPSYDQIWNQVVIGGWTQFKKFALETETVWNREVLYIMEEIFFFIWWLRLCFLQFKAELWQSDRWWNTVISLRCSPAHYGILFNDVLFMALLVCTSSIVSPQRPPIPWRGRWRTEHMAVGKYLLTRCWLSGPRVVRCFMTAPWKFYYRGASSFTQCTGERISEVSPLGITLTEACIIKARVRGRRRGGTAM